MRTRAAALLLGAAAVVALSFPAAGFKDYRGRLRGLEAERRRLRAVQPPAGDDRAAVVRDQMRGLDALMDEMVPAIERLAALAGSYDAADDPTPFETKRSSLRAGLEGQLQRFQPLLKAYNMRRKREGLLEIRRLLTDHKEYEADALLAVGTEQEYFYRTAVNAGRCAADLLREDEEGWQELLLRADERRFRRRAAGGGAATLLILVGAGAAVYRRRARATTIQSTPVTAPLLPGPSAAAAQTLSPAALSGPAGTPALAPGAILGGNYRVERELGRGGMGVVVEALDLTLQRKVAVKLMLAEASQEPAELDRFLAEARLVAALKHPNIVEIHTLFREGPSLCLVFECVPGYPLSAYLARSGRLAARPAASVARQMASALDYAHSLKVIHRDLKPANVMVTPAGVAKVMDFGLAHQAKMTLARVTRTDSWGTMPYMAPEQEVGEVSRESDLYAFGVCLYEMLTGKLPFAGPDFLAQKRAQRYPPPSAAGLPNAVDGVLSRALAPAPKDRFHSAAELAAALEAGLGPGVG